MYIFDEKKTDFGFVKPICFEENLVAFIPPLFCRIQPGSQEILE